MITGPRVPDEILRGLQEATSAAQPQAPAPAPDGLESPFAPVAAGNGTRAEAADMYGAFSVETFANGTPLSDTHEDAGGWLDYVDNFAAPNFWYQDANVQVWAYEQEYDNWEDTYGMDAVVAVYHSGHGVTHADGRYEALLGGTWDGRTRASSDRMRLGDEQVRYVFWSTCQSLRVLDGHNPIRTWQPANLGFRMLFGYETDSLDHPDYGKAFWTHWQTGKSFSTAFMDASWYDISTEQAPAVVACGATPEEARDRLYNERLFSSEAVSSDYWEWRWYNAAASAMATRPRRFEIPAQVLTGRLARRRVDGRYADEVRAKLDVPVAGAAQAVHGRAGVSFLARDGAARLAVQADGSFDAAFRAPNHENTTALGVGRAVAGARDFAAYAGLGEGDLVLDRVLQKWSAGGRSKGDGDLSAPRVTETVVQFTQQLDGMPVLAPGRGQVSVSLDNDGAVTAVRDTTRPVLELSSKSRRPAAEREPRRAPSPADARRGLDRAWERRMRGFLAHGRLPVGFAEVPGSAEIGYAIKGDEAVLTARREISVDCGDGFTKRYRVEAPLAG
ncbi:MAG TPA: DUF6345 domain-containing protein [Solirubrobacteraceae bacterium]|nr:DUF6345 domain-containing protein [Solirubrobacteraceae bacterium]